MHSPAFVRQGSPQAVCTGSLQDPPQTGTFIVNTSTDSVAAIQMAQGDESHSSERCTTPPGQGSPQAGHRKPAGPTSPRYFCTNSLPTTRMKAAVVWWATALASMVFPVPGAPYSSTPRGGSMPICLYSSWWVRGSSTASLISCFWMSLPPMSYKEERCPHGLGACLARRGCMSIASLQAC